MSFYSKGFIAMPHSPNFAVDEKCIESAVVLFIISQKSVCNPALKGI